LTEKRILNTAGEDVYYRVASSLQAYVTTLYAAAGIKGGSSHSGRRTLASNLIREGHALETVQTLLGHKDMDVTACYIDVDTARLREMFEAVL
jgi:integrase/recombinase XerD